MMKVWVVMIRCSRYAVDKRYFKAIIYKCLNLLQYTAVFIQKMFSPIKKNKITALFDMIYINKKHLFINLLFFQQNNKSAQINIHSLYNNQNLNSFTSRILNRKNMTSPVIFIFNIRRSVYEAFGTSHFNSIKNIYKNIHLLPIINNLDQSIEQRAKKISQKLPLMLQKLNAEQAHLISYSVSGLDSRFALSCLNMGQHCKSLTTICTPHKGSKTASFSQQKFFTRTQTQPIARLLGIGIKPFHQVVPENIKYFNDEVTDVEHVKYFSMGAERLPNNCNPSLREISHYLRVNTKRNFTYENDGVFGYDEIEWGEHLVNFDADHSQVVGISGTLKKIQTFDLALENIQSVEVESQSSSK